MPTGLSLKARVKLLDAQVAALTLTVQQQGYLIEELQASGGGSSSEFEVLPVSQNDRAVSATAVSGHLGASEPEAPAFVPVLPAAASSTSGAQSLPSLSVEDRSAIAREVGAFLRRALDGLPLHSSGRDRGIASSARTLKAEPCLHLSLLTALALCVTGASEVRTAAEAFSLGFQASGRSA